MNEPREVDPRRAADKVAALKAEVESRRAESRKAEAALVRDVELLKEKLGETSSSATSRVRSSLPWPFPK